MFERQMPDHFGGALWADQTMAHPLGIAALIAALVALFLLPRRYAMLPLIFIAVALPGAQRIAVLTLDFTFIRIVILATLALAAFRGHTRGLRFGMPDFLIGLWVCWGIIAGGILSGDSSGIIGAAGHAIGTFGAYLIGRTYIRSLADLRRYLLWLSFIAIPMLAFFLVEQFTGRNVFGFFGGVPEETIIRNGRMRAQGPFSHPIMAGVFWASLLPCIGALWIARAGSRPALVLSILCMGLIVVNTASSTPIMAVLFGIFGMALFPLRHYLRVLVTGVFAAMLGLHMVMEMPIWHLIARIDLSNGSTGWHRYNLIQQSINHFNEWWAFGTESTGHWGWGLQDITNQYILEGVSGGLLQMLLFIALLTCIFLRLGRKLRQTRSRAAYWLLWGVGVTLFVHCMSFLAVSYFGQLVCLFFIFLGSAVAVSETKRRTAIRQAPAMPHQAGPIGSPG
ncbi:hypothetical protein AUP74_01016 [Microbulbifer aggregans]|uniref:O-Antigen ligase n=1 Tax=Microbulbifer aggregans TaxID=1769779 RepID=A0A1C9W5R4_9GAMM|nr:hypothetical protein [Microbulbifer aggregans]AOS96481.1 hypothetical protein AUP74_01016 [Microbulbifer aggregans]